MRLATKAKVHIEDFVWSKNLKFIFYRMLNIINRRVSLPPIIFSNDVTKLASEKYLMKYMIPKHHGCFIDVGANIGFWTVPLAEKGIIIHAFEPSPRPYKHLKKLAEHYPNIHVYPYALGEKNQIGTLNLHYTSGHDGLVIKAHDFAGVQIPCKVRTLDSFHFMNVGLIKIDTEGYEVPILKGMVETVKQNKPRLIIEVHMPYIEQASKIMDILESWNYRWVKRYKRSPRGEIRNPQPHIIGDSE